MRSIFQFLKLPVPYFPDGARRRALMSYSRSSTSFWAVRGAVSSSFRYTAGMLLDNQYRQKSMQKPLLRQWPSSCMSLMTSCVETFPQPLRIFVLGSSVPKAACSLMGPSRRADSKCSFTNKDRCQRQGDLGAVDLFQSVVAPKPRNVGFDLRRNIRAGRTNSVKLPNKMPL